MSDGSRDLCYLPLERLATLIRCPEVSLVGLTRAVLVAADRLDGGLNSFITPFGTNRWLRRAPREGHRGRSVTGTAARDPIVVRTSATREGVRTTGGSKVLANFVPAHDATVVTRLREAGAVLVGKLNMHEFARGATNTSSLVDPCHNPWDVERVSGGSSGGSGAAVAAGLCFSPPSAPIPADRSGTPPPCAASLD